MIYSQKIREAIQFSIHTHEIVQHQKRKGKDIPYITHPLTVGLILARASTGEDTIVAGILHDTIEDSVSGHSVTIETLRECFGENVALLVDSVTESTKELPWQERKDAALARVATFSHQSVLVKAADVISNDWELLEDYRVDGDSIFERFKVSKEQRLQHQFQMIDALQLKWPESPLAKDLEDVATALNSITRSGPGPKELNPLSREGEGQG